MKIKQLGFGFLMSSIIALSGCSSAYDQDAIDEYIDATKAMQEMKSAEVSMKILIEIKEEASPVKAKVTLDGALMQNTPLDFDASIDMGMAVNGLSIKDQMHLYMKDGSLYYDIMGVKQQLPMKELFDSMQKAQPQKDVLDEAYIRTIFSEFKYKDQEKGILTFTYDQDTFYDTMEEAQTTNQVILHELSGTFTIKDGRYEDMTMVMDMESNDLQYTMELQGSIDRYNEITSIDFPDFEGYTKASLHEFEDGQSNPFQKKLPTNGHDQDSLGDDL